MIDTIIFDLDGTLLNTLNDLHYCLNETLKRYNLPLKTYDQTRQYVGNGIKTLINRALDDNHKELLDDAFKTFLELYEIHQLDTTKPYEGIIDLVIKLSKRNIKMAIVSNKIEKAVNEICKPIFYPSIKVMLGETNTLKRKPAPDMVYEAIKRLNSNPNNVLFVGDSETDIQTAKNANVKVCAVSWGFRDKDTLLKLEPDYLIDKPNQLLDLLETF